MCAPVAVPVIAAVAGGVVAKNKIDKKKRDAKKEFERKQREAEAIAAKKQAELDKLAKEREAEGKRQQERLVALKKEQSDLRAAQEAKVAALKAKNEKEVAETRARGAAVSTSLRILGSQKGTQAPTATESKPKPKTRGARTTAASLRLGSTGTGAGAGSITYDMLNEQAGMMIANAITDDFRDIPEKEIDQNILSNAARATKTAAYWNAGAAALTPFIMGPLGKAAVKLFGAKSEKAARLSEFARDKGLPLPLMTGIEDGVFSDLGRNYFKTVGVFPFVSGIISFTFPSRSVSVVFGRYPPPGFVITASSIAPSFILTKPPAVEPFSQLS